MLSHRSEMQCLVQMGTQKSMAEHRAVRPTLTIYSQPQCVHTPVPCGSGLTPSALQRSHLNAIKPVRKPARRTNIQKREWAHEVDINKPMTNFHELVPEMAHKVGNCY